MIELSDNAKQVVSRLREGPDLGGDINDKIQFMRASGLSFLDCMKVVITLTSCTIGEAKRLVHQSPAWAEEKFEREATADRLLDDAQLAFGTDDRMNDGENSAG